MMKKIVLSLTAVFAFGLASAQSVVVEDVTVDGLVSSKGIIGKTKCTVFQNEMYNFSFKKIISKGAIL